MRTNCDPCRECGDCPVLRERNELAVFVTGEIDRAAERTRKEMECQEKTASDSKDATRTLSER